MTVSDLLPVIAGLFGACVGSFLNVCIYRIPQEKLSVAEPRWSFCPRCEKRIRWYDNIPLLSWVFLGAKCRDCRAPIAIRYPMVEALTAALFVLAALEMGDGSASAQNLVTIGFWSLLFAALLVITYIDIDHRIIPDEISVTGAALAPLIAFLLPSVPTDALLPAAFRRIPGGVWDWGSGAAGWFLVGGGSLLLGALAMVFFRRFSLAWDGSRRTWWDTRLAGSVGVCIGIYALGLVAWKGWSARPESVRLLASLLGMVVGSGSIYSVGVLGKLVFRKDAMGFGDVKLMALLGAVIGWKGVLIAFFVACLLGSVVGIVMKIVTKSSYMPFGPYLSAGAVIMILWSDYVQAGIDWYMSLFPK